MRRLRMGMVGGGEGAFIGAVHRMAAVLDGRIELVCGAFSRDAACSVRSGLSLNLSESRCYENYQQMFEREQALPEDQKMEFVAIVTPNSTHFEIAKMAIEHGFSVMSDKPATFSLAESKALKALLSDSDCLYGLTHTYTGYPMIKEARERIANGELGQIKKVIVEYNQGWLAEDPGPDNKQAAWRLNPVLAGASCCMGDIGVHAANLAEYLCSDGISEICADLVATVPGRVLDDDGTVLFKLSKGGKGVLIASQISTGEENNLRIRIYGDKGALEWAQQEPNTLWLKFLNAPEQKLRTGVGQLSDLAQANIRTPAGHPEGYIEAFANIYRNFAGQLLAKKENRLPTFVESDVPGIDEALRGMAFIESVVAASDSTDKWQPLCI